MTLCIDDDVLGVAQEIAAARKISVVEALSELAQEGLAPIAAALAGERPIVKHGVHMLPGRRGVVTSELVRRLLDKEDQELIARMYRVRMDENDFGYR